MEYHEKIDKYDLYPTRRLPINEKRSLNRSLSYMFNGINLDGARVLDVGAGRGRMSLYMAERGADVLAIEPEDDGVPGESVFSTLSDLAAESEGLTAKRAYLDDIDSSEEFDLIFMHNVINHLDEDATKVLHVDETAKEAYREHFRHLHHLCAPSGSVLISDADRKHWYQHLGLEHPLTSNIEWEKHQAPELWAALLEDVGFETVSINWCPTPGLGPLARFSTNYVVSHLFGSHFRLHVSKQVTSTEPT